NLSNSPWEFSYALGASRPLALKASAKRCNFCPQNFIGGIEMYGGLGDRHSFGLHDTSHYLAPVLGWNLPSGWTLRISPGFGLNDTSHQFLMRWGVSREITGFGAMVSRLFGGRKWKPLVRRSPVAFYFLRFLLSLGRTTIPINRPPAQRQTTIRQSTPNCQ